MRETPKRHWFQFWVPSRPAPHELVIPPAAAVDASARELLRVWATGGQQHISLAADAWDDPAAWGVALADLARHVAEAYRQTKGFDPEKTAARIKAGFDAEWSGPTDKPTGHVID